jgi:BlaI family penicillinase repressor
MKKLTNKEREIMKLFWEHGPLFVRELLDFYPDPKPHFNTLSTMVRRLEADGCIGHKQYGSTYQYFAVMSEEEFAKSSVSSIISDYFDDSYKSLVSAFVKDEKLSVDDLREIIQKVEDYDKKNS